MYAGLIMRADIYEGVLYMWARRCSLKEMQDLSKVRKNTEWHRVGLELTSSYASEPRSRRCHSCVSAICQLKLRHQAAASGQRTSRV